MNSVNVVVMAFSAKGEAALPTYAVSCTEEEIILGIHYARAIEMAIKEGYKTFHAFDATDEVAKTLLSAAADLGLTPKVAVFIEGGMVTSVVSDSPVMCAVIDYDTEGAAAHDIVNIPQYNGKSAEASASQGPAECQPDTINSVYAAIGGNDSLADVPETVLFALCEQLGIQLVASREVMMDGYWEWIDGKAVSDMSLESKQLAAVDALGARFPVRHWREDAPEKDYFQWIKEKSQEEIPELV